MATVVRCTLSDPRAEHAEARPAGRTGVAEAANLTAAGLGLGPTRVEQVDAPTDDTTQADGQEKEPLAGLADRKPAQTPGEWCQAEDHAYEGKNSPCAEARCGTTRCNHKPHAIAARGSKFG